MTQRSIKFKRVPSSTYRVQLTPAFDFDAARSIVPYLERLGISDLYLSPIFAARPGSTHGYDVVDPLQLSPELGGQEAFDRLVASLQSRDMGLMLDIVPNHMAASSENPWWVDVLENGPSSRYASFFDIEWDPAAPGMPENRVLLPILGSPYGETLENGELSIAEDDSGYHLRYYDTNLPLSTISYLPLLHLRAEAIERALGSESPDWKSYSQLLRDVAEVPSRAASHPALIGQRESIRNRLEVELPRLRQVPIIRRELELTVNQVNGDRGEPDSYDTLDRIISAQAYRLAFWQLARERINYRRFFDVNDLVSLHVEDETVFHAVHERVIQLARRGAVTGLRIDHIDGLWDPDAYLKRLQRSLTSDDEVDSNHGAMYVVVEKILAEAERMPEEWPVAGTTGYDFLNTLNGLLVDYDGRDALASMYADVTGLSTPFRELVYRAKKRVLDESFAANVHSLSVMLAEIAHRDRHGRDLPFESMRQAIIEITACLPVYRTYVNRFDVDERDRHWIESSIREALSRKPDLRHSIAFTRRVLLLEIPTTSDDEQRTHCLDFVMRWQQLTGPAMAKGNEDTALYQFNCLVALNEVGGDPSARGTSIEDWHQRSQQMAKSWPHSLNATSTHDAKRSEDVRARIAVLSELPDEWSRRVQSWSRLNSDKKQSVDGTPVPDANVELLILQTMIGGWPFDERNTDDFRRRLNAYVTKAAREAKTYTSWINVNEDYESAIRHFVDTLFDPQSSQAFLDDFRELQASISRAGAINSLTQTLLKLTAPGVPDVYQGNELWDFSLVDPDNRRPVDYEMRRDQISRFPIGYEEGGAFLTDLVENWPDGRVKMWLIHRVLVLRNERARLFDEGEYIPLRVAGTFRDKVIAFARQLSDETAITIAPRLVFPFVRDQFELSLAGKWADTVVMLPQNVRQSLVEQFTSQKLAVHIDDGVPRVTVNDVLQQFPCGLLVTQQ